MAYHCHSLLSIMVISSVVLATSGYTSAVPKNGPRVKSDPYTYIPLPNVPPYLYTSSVKKVIEGEGKFFCELQSSWSTRTYLPPRLLCDGHVDCPKGDDERGCLPKPDISFPDFSMCHGKYMCEVRIVDGTLSPICISIRNVCDGFIDCLGGIDEQNCPYIPPPTPSPTLPPVVPEPALTLPRFSACADQHYTNAQLPLNTAIDFAEVLVDVGDNYDPMTGVYTVPITGDYEISWSYLINRDGGLWVGLFVDGSFYALASSSATAPNYEQVQRSIILHLEAGQTLYLARTNGPGSIYGVNGRYSCFTGQYLPETI